MIRDKFENRVTGFLRIGFNEYQTIGIHQLATIGNTGAEELVKILSLPGKEVASFFNNEEFENITQNTSVKRLFRETFDMESLLSFPLALNTGKTLTWCFYSRRPDTYSTEHLAVLVHLQQTLCKIDRKACGHLVVTQFAAKLSKLP
jgi:hypothetical protein